MNNLILITQGIALITLIIASASAWFYCTLQLLKPVLCLSIFLLRYVAGTLQAIHDDITYSPSNM